MKTILRYILPYVVGIMLFCPIRIVAQNDPDFCKIMLDSAVWELKNRHYNAAREYCEAALPLCNANSQAIRDLMHRINDAIDGEKRGAENAATFMKTKETDRKSVV